ncbi:MAG: glycosyl hydrolase, partial [Gemmatimonadetes bacterium]|nr:glycosyl hydrolase [Gemmatimonadota bacterium]
MNKPAKHHSSPCFAQRIAACLFAGGMIAAGLMGLLLAPAAVAAQEDDEAFARATSALRFRTIGPTIMGGRVAELAVVESDPSTFYVGVATGGVWKTENAGITFEHVFRDEATASVGAVSVAPSNPNVVWVGTGEPNNRQSSPWGNGVYRSIDAGRTWTHLGLENTHHIGRIRVHPMDPDVAYVAAVGHLWGANPERGVYRTTDGGETWELLLFVDENTGAIDLAMDPTDPKTLFAAMYQRQRRAWGFNGGGPGSGIYRTTDGGDTWTELTNGLPSGDKGRIGLDIYRGDTDMIFALVEADARGPGGFGGGGLGPR